MHDNFGLSLFTRAFKIRWFHLLILPPVIRIDQRYTQMIVLSQTMVVQGALFLGRPIWSLCSLTTTRGNDYGEVSLFKSARQGLVPCV